MITDDKDLYIKADAFADHGHDHLYEDRGMDDHPILGVNYRISELNAAVGLAQIKKLDSIIETQRRNKDLLKNSMTHFAEISFREIPDKKGDSATFLSFFLPDEARAREVIKDLGLAGVDASFYWYDNNWHYIRNWHHLKELKSAAKLPIELLEHTPDYSQTALPKSDSIMKRAISMLIKLAWTENEIEERIQKISSVLIK